VSPLVPTDRTTDARDQGDESTIRPSGGAGTVWRSPICRSRIHRGIRPVRCLLWTIDDAGERRQARQPGAPSRASIPSGSNTPGVRRAGCRTCGRYRRTLPRTVDRSPMTSRSWVPLTVTRIHGWCWSPPSGVEFDVSLGPPVARKPVSRTRLRRVRQTGSGDDTCWSTCR